MCASYLSIYLSTYLSIYLSICKLGYLSIYLFIFELDIYLFLKRSSALREPRTNLELQVWCAIYGYIYRGRTCMKCLVLILKSKEMHSEYILENLVRIIWVQYLSSYNWYVFYQPYGQRRFERSLRT